MITPIPGTSKYGNFWVFASDNNVLNKFLELAQVELGLNPSHYSK